MGLFDFLLGASLAGGNGHKEHVEKLRTKAYLVCIAKALEQFGYEDIERTSMAITAHYGDTWSTNGHISYIQVSDMGDYRECINTETSEGELCSPESGRLSKIIKYAEDLQKLIEK